MKVIAAFLPLQWMDSHASFCSLHDFRFSLMSLSSWIESRSSREKNPRGNHLCFSWVALGAIYKLSEAASFLLLMVTLLLVVFLQAYINTKRLTVTEINTLVPQVFESPASATATCSKKIPYDSWPNKTVVNGVVTPKSRVK